MDEHVPNLMKTINVLIQKKPHTSMNPEVKETQRKPHQGTS